MLGLSKDPECAPENAEWFRDVDRGRVLLFAAFCARNVSENGKVKIAGHGVIKLLD